ncbi:Nn.00g081580.m01.CDS01 [Neocucurbitaria sp. VM-36]
MEQSVEKRYSGKMVGKVPIVVFATSLKQDVGLLEYDSGSKDATSVVGIEEPVSVIDLEDLSATDTPGCAVLDEASKEGFD